MTKPRFVKFQRWPSLHCLVIAVIALAVDHTAAQQGINPEAFVECRVDGRLVMKRARECVGRNAVVREVDAKVPAGGSSQWAAIEGDQGVALQPFLACRDSTSLESVISNDAGTRTHLARAMVLSGHCVGLPTQTSFRLLARAGGRLRIRTHRLGPLWVAENEEIPGLKATDTPRLRPYPGDVLPEAGLSQLFFLPSD